MRYIVKVIINEKLAPADQQLLSADTASALSLCECKLEERQSKLGIKIIIIIITIIIIGKFVNVNGLIY